MNWQNPLRRGGGQGTPLPVGIVIAFAMICLVFAVLAFSPPPAVAAVEKEVVTLVVDAGTSISATRSLAGTGTITKAWLVSPTDAVTTKTVQVSAWNGRSLPEIVTGQTTTTASGTTQLSALDGHPVWGETRLRILTGANEIAERTFYVLLFYWK